MPVNYGTRLFGGTAIALGVMLVSINAGAQDGTIAVSAQVVATCEVVGGGAELDFGEYNPATPIAKETSTEFSVSCSTETVLLVALNAGSNGAGDQRRMTDGSSHLNYDLYQEDGTTLFGDGTALGARKQVSASNLEPGIVEVVGSIPSDQTIPTGSYTDSVTITLTFL